MDELMPKKPRIVARSPRDESIRLRFEGGEVEAKLQDISISGMGILTQHQFELGAWFVVEPVEPGRRFSPELRAEVLHSTKCDTKGYRVGCRFIRLLTIEDVAAFG